MGSGVTVQSLFSSLRESLESVASAIPTQADIAPPTHGLSLLDTKSELLLSYLHNLVFLILIKTRQSPLGVKSASSPGSLNDEVVRKLVELRVYLEKGVKPLEGRLKYQIDKVIRAADDAARKPGAREAPSDRRARTSTRMEDGRSDSGSVSSEVDDDIAESSYRPNPAAMLLSKASSATVQDRGSDRQGLYRPPRIAATAMPAPRGAEERQSRRPLKSAVIDEYIATEMSSAPVAEPSIGSTIVASGRRTKSDRERAEEAERREYEETNFVRLPKESKKERAKRGARDRGGFGGEEWRNIDAGLDRIDRLTQKKKGGGTKLAQSRKRAVEDGPRDSGFQVGDKFEKRRRLDTRKRRG